MSLPKQLIIKETMPELKKLLKSASAFIAPRIRVIIEIKKAGEKGISKRELADNVGVNHNSTQKWRKMYQDGGIDALCSHNKTGFKPTILPTNVHQAIDVKLNDPKNGLRGYVELLDWIRTEFKQEIKYNTLLKYCIKNFGSKVKVARKSHVNKDQEKVEAFKKTSLGSANKS